MTAAPSTKFDLHRIDRAIRLYHDLMGNLQFHGDVTKGQKGTADADNKFFTVRNGKHHNCASAGDQAEMERIVEEMNRRTMPIQIAAIQVLENEINEAVADQGTR